MKRVGSAWRTFWLTFQGSVALLNGRLSVAALERDIRRKYSEPLELATAQDHRRAGLSDGERRLLHGLLARGDRVLDVGCGAGRATFALRASGHAALGVDVTEAMVRSAVHREAGGPAPSGFCVMEARALGFRDRTFDAVLMLGSVLAYIRHRPERQKALGETYRVLRPGGRLLVVTPSRVSSWKFRVWFALMGATWRIRRLLGRPSSWEPGDRVGPAWSGDRSHLVYWHMYAPAELARDLTSAGFGILHASADGYMMAFAARKPAG